MLIDSERIKQTKEQIEVMQAFIDGKEIEFKPDLYKGTWKASTTPTWDFSKYKYRIKTQEPVYKYPIYKKSKEYGTVVKFTGLCSGEYINKNSSFNVGHYNNNLIEHTDDTFWEDYIPEPEFMYPIYKRLKHSPETVVEFHSINSGIYISTFEDSNCRPGDITSNMAKHTDSAWEDYTVSVDAKKIPLSLDTIELFEVIKFSDGKYFIKASLVSQNTIDSDNNLMKTGRSFLINQSTKQVLKVNNN